MYTNVYIEAPTMPINNTWWSRHGQLENIFFWSVSYHKELTMLMRAEALTGTISG